jgi:hypothetical protein
MRIWTRTIPAIRALLRARPFPVWSTDYKRARVHAQRAGVALLPPWNDALEVVGLADDGEELELRGEGRATCWLGGLDELELTYTHNTGTVPQPQEVRFTTDPVLMQQHRARGVQTKLLGFEFGNKQIATPGRTR